MRACVRVCVRIAWFVGPYMKAVVRITLHGGKGTLDGNRLMNVCLNKTVFAERKKQMINSEEQSYLNQR